MTLKFYIKKEEDSLYFEHFFKVVYNKARKIGGLWIKLRKLKYEFCMDNHIYSEDAYQSDPEGEEPSADVTLDEVGLCKGQKFTLHYDFGDDWMFTITVSKIVEVQKDFSPRIVKAKGSIQQYPDWNEDEFDYE